MVIILFVMITRQKLKERRDVRSKVINKWGMLEWEEDPPGCGFPVCANIDSKPKRFRSLCQLVLYMKNNNMVRRVLHIQKGDCADASK